MTLDVRIFGKLHIAEYREGVLVLVIHAAGRWGMN
jgi:hypothetical protein